MPSQDGIKTKSGRESRSPHVDLQGTASTRDWSSAAPPVGGLGGLVCSGRQSGLPGSPPTLKQLRGFSFSPKTRSPCGLGGSL